MRFIGVVLCLLGFAIPASADCIGGGDLSARHSTSSLMEIIYGLQSVQVRRIIVPDSDAELGPQWVGDGEGCLIIDRSADINQAVQDATGKAPSDPAAAVLDADGNVEKVIAADPAIDIIPGKTLVPAFSGVAEGQKYDPKTDTFTIPGGPTVVTKRGTKLIDGSTAPADVVVDMPDQVLTRPAEASEATPLTLDDIRNAAPK